MARDPRWREIPGGAEILRSRIIHFRDTENGLPGIVLALHRTTHHTLHALGGALADLNLGAAEINALANLADRGALNVRELSAETGTRATTLTGVLDRLENRGYLDQGAGSDRPAVVPAAADRGGPGGSRAGPGRRHRPRAGRAARLSETQIAGFHAVVAALQAAS